MHLRAPRGRTELSAAGAASQERARHSVAQQAQRGNGHAQQDAVRGGHALNVACRGRDQQPGMLR